LGVDVRVTSAGRLDDGNPAAEHSVALLAERGLDLSSHRSTTMTADAVRSADLVLGMAREHVREAVVTVPDAFPKSFTLKELVRRGELLGPRPPHEDLASYLRRAHAGRTSRDLLGNSPADDVADPIGLPRAAYQQMVTELQGLLDRLVRLLWVPRYEKVV
jgi:protein-tyrosine phosphatase